MMKIDNGFQNLSSILKKKEIKKVNTTEWQGLALEIIATIPNADKKKGSVFKACKLNYNAAKFAFIDCKELDKLFVDYFFKVYNIINNRKTYESNIIRENTN